MTSVTQPSVAQVVVPMSKPSSPQFGRYKVLHEIGRGAMGVVYQARDPKIERLVAIKSISLFGQSTQDTRDFRERFFIEAKAAGRLSHPRIVTIYDVGEEAETQNPYIVMEYVAGESLEALLSRNQGKLPFPTALQFVQEIADALDYAHSKGIIHRDIKPSNILITEDGHAKIADFGVAKLDLTNMTLAGHAFGTPAYMSPEQLNGDPLDGRSDLFSLGVILYAVLTGHRPFQGNSALTVSFRVVNREPLRASALDPDLPPNFDYVIERAIAKDVAQRYQSGMEMALDLEDVRNGCEPRTKTGVGGASATGRSAVPLKGTAKVALNQAGVRSQGQLLGRAVGFLQNWPLWQYIGAAALVAGILAIGFSASRPLSLPAEQIVSTADTRVAAKQATTTSDADAGMNIRTQRQSDTPAAISAKAKANSKTRANEVSAPKVVATQNNQKPSVQPVNLKEPKPAPGLALHIRVEHHLAQGELYLWVDDKLTLRRSLGGTVTKRMVVFKGVQGLESDSVQVPSGDHRLRVRVQSADNKYDETRTISGNLPSAGERVLEIDCNKRKDMRLTLQ